MRTNIDIDDALMADAMKASGFATKKATVGEALRLLVQRQRRQSALARLSGLGWEGHLAAMRDGQRRR